MWNAPVSQVLLFEQKCIAAHVCSATTLRKSRNLRRKVIDHPGLRRFRFNGDKFFDMAIAFFYYAYIIM